MTWNGQLRRLHGVWDDEMVERDAGGNSTAVIARYSAMLTERINVGAFPGKDQWVSCVDVATPEVCALDWALDANALNCQYVLKTDVRNKELNGTYYAGAQPLIELQIAKGGYRLGHYLNNLAAADAGDVRELKV